LRVDNISKAVSGKCILYVARPDEESLVIHFADRSTLLVERRGRKLSVALGASADSLRERASGPLPTLRQGEYLDFIKKYISRFGVSPAESDIQRHFMVSAPSAHQMVVMLERLGFITRAMGVARSIRVVEASAEEPP